MRSSSSRSPDAWSSLLRRFVEASRRAQVLAHTSAAPTRNALGTCLASDLAATYDAEIGFFLHRQSSTARLETIATTGLTRAQRDRLAADPIVDGASRGLAGVVGRGDDLLGVGARTVAVASARSEGGIAVVGVARLDCYDFDEPAVALLETIAKDASLVLERLFLERQLREAQRLESVGRLAAGVAHDFNNLLTAVVGYADLALACSDAGDGRASAAMHEIKAAADRAAALTRQLLAFSRKQTLQPEVVDLNDLVGGMTGMVEIAIGAEVRLETKLAPGLRPVVADVRQLENVVLNLALNARDAMATGGTLTFATTSVELAQPCLADPEEIAAGSYVVLSVTDTGTGIAAAVLPHIFEPFYTTKDGGRGIGLGLASAHGVVRQSGGYIAVTSTPGEGTTFDIYLPPAAIDAAPAGAPVQSDDTTAVPSSGETILVVDDDERVRDLVCQLLENEGYHVIDACDGAAALGVADAPPQPIDLLLVDVAMPGMRGTDVARRITARHPDAAVVFMSGYDDNSLADAEFGRVQLAKPFTAAAMQRAVRAALDGRVRRRK